MITIHNRNSTSFNTLGIGTLVPISCAVKEELNGLFELEMIHPYDEWGKWESIENGNIIYASTPRGKQAFRIYNTKPTMENITVYAKHIFYDLLDNYIQSVTITGQSPQMALNSLKSAFNYSVPFLFTTTLTGTGNMAVANLNPVAALLSNGKDNDSFVSVFGGEILRDNYNVTFKPSIGSDKGVYIRYSKNLVGLEVEEDISEVCTRIFPIGKDGLKGNPIDSSHINDYPYPKARKYEDSSLTSQSQLAAFAQNLFNSGVDLPTVNIQVDFQMLAKTEEYKNFAILEDVQLGDVVTVSNTRMNFSKKASVISYDWNCLLEQYNKVELGDFVADITSSITSGQKSYEVATGASTEVKQVMNQISGRTTITSEYTYYPIDHTDYTQATELYRMGRYGYQYSSTGYNGTWVTLKDKNI